MKKFAVLILVGAAALSFGAVYADSADCAGGTTTPAGISVLQTGDPTTGPASLTVCLDDSAVPTPIQGSAKISGDANAQTGYVEADGDASNEATAACADGFFRVQDDGNIAHSPDGDYNDPDGDGDAGPAPQVDDLPTFLQETAADCGP
jgi:hypothetical protein